MDQIKTFNMVYSLDDGGVQNFSINLYKYMDHNHVRIDFITKTKKKEFYDDVLHSIGGKKIALTDKKSHNKLIINIDRFFNAIKIFKKDYSLGYFSLKSPADALKYPLLFSITTRKKVIIHAHSSSDDKKGIFHYIMNMIGRKMIKNMNYTMFSCSDKASEWMFGKDISLKGRVHCIKNGIETQKFKFDPQIRREVRKELSLTDEDYAIVHVGRFTQAKNHEFIIDLAEKLKEEYDKSVKFFLVGVGEKSEVIKNEVERRKINNIIFLGQRRDVERVLQGVDLFILPSLYEGLPIVGIEAQTSGLKCLVSDRVSRDMDMTGNVIYLPLDLNIWVQNIIDNVFLVNNREDAVKKIIDNGFDIETEAHKVEDLIDKICKNV